MSTFGPWMQANVLPVDGLNTSAPASSSWQFSERPNLPEQLASIIHGPFWWLPLPILQDTALIAVNQPLSNSCLVIQNQRGTKTGQNHGKINPNRSLEIFSCKKSDYSRRYHRYSICLLTQYASFVQFQDKMKAKFSNDRFGFKHKNSSGGLRPPQHQV